jgi:sulfur relay (sulfurtransferase) DsrF/TusC family protein
MGAAESRRLALIVRNPPWGRRAARSDVDPALAAAAMDFRLEVYLLGAALMQLAAERDSSNAMLPAGYRAWAALPDLAEVTFFAEREWLKRCDRAAIRLLLPVQALSAEAMQSGWRACDFVWVY